MNVKRFRTATATWLRGCRGGTDLARWAKDESFDPWWDERTKLMIEPIPARSIVVDVGAGRMAARQMLPPDCKYIPIDLVRRTPETIVCDLNSQRLPELTADWVLMSGVLEYIADVGGALRWAGKTAQNLSMSMSLTDSDIPHLQRLEWGWVQHLSRPSVDRLLSDAGFAVQHEQTWSKQLLVIATRK